MRIYVGYFFPLIHGKYPLEWNYKDKYLSIQIGDWEILQKKNLLELKPWSLYRIKQKGKTTECDRSKLIECNNLYQCCMEILARSHNPTEKLTAKKIALNHSKWSKRILLAIHKLQKIETNAIDLKGRRKERNKKLGEIKPPTKAQRKAELKAKLNKFMILKRKVNKKIRIMKAKLGNIK